MVKHIGQILFFKQAHKVRPKTDQSEAGSLMFMLATGNEVGATVNFKCGELLF